MRVRILADVVKIALRIAFTHALFIIHHDSENRRAALYGHIRLVPLVSAPFRRRTVALEGSLG